MSSHATNFAVDDGHGPVTSYDVKNWIGIISFSIYPFSLSVSATGCIGGADLQPYVIR